MRTVVVIPARLSSTRLPRKILVDICGSPMIEHVYTAAKKAKNISDVYIATDSLEIKEVCQHFTSNIIMTKDTHETGTDRLAEAITKIECDNIINVQGDEPLIDPNLISKLAETLVPSEMTMVSAMHRIHNSDLLHSPNTVKVVVDRENYALYFSRSIIPYHADIVEDITKLQNRLTNDLYYYKHIGIYGYKKHFLLEYTRMKQGYLEQLEKLEQLRALEYGYRIKMIETNYEPIGVDVYTDLERVRKVMKCG